MRRRTVLVLLAATVSIGGVAACLTRPPRRPEPPPVFWMRVTEGHTRPGVYAEPEGLPLGGLADVRGGAGDESPTAFFGETSRRYRFLYPVDRALGTDLAWRFGRSRPLFRGARFSFFCPGPAPQFENGWQSFVYLPEGLPDNAVARPAQAGVWRDEATGDTLRLGADATFHWRSEDDDGFDLRGRWGARGECVLLASQDTGPVHSALVVEKDGTLSLLPDGEQFHRHDP